MLQEEEEEDSTGTTGVSEPSTPLKHRRRQRTATHDNPTDRSEDTNPAVGQVMLAAKVLGAYHVMNCLMRPFHHSVCLGISHCDRPSYDAIVAEE
jgi:hypothetical protein